MVAGDKPTAGDDLDLLGPEEKHLFGSGTGTIIYVSQDRTDLQFAARVLAAAISAPTRKDLLRLRRAVKYLVATVHYVLQFAYQDAQKYLLAMVYADWAGDKITRTSTAIAAWRLSASY